MSSAVAALAGRSYAHQRASGAGSERRIELDLAHTPIRLIYGLCSSGELADRLRLAADRNRDGVIGPDEANAALDAHSLELLDGLRVCSGDTLDRPELECRRLLRRDIETVDAEGWSPAAGAHLHFTWRLSLGVSADRVSALRIEDSDETPGMAITGVRIVPPDRPLLVAGDGAHPSGVARDFNWIEAARGPGPRVVVVSWQPPEPRASPIAFIAALLGLAAAIAGWCVRRRRAMSPGRATARARCE